MGIERGRMSTFDLVYEPWLAAAGDGGPRPLPLRLVLRDAQSIPRLAGRSPAVDAAVFLHVILGAYLDLAGVPRTAAEWKQRWENGRIDPAAIDEWCGDVSPRFDLFDPAAPFAQVADLQAANGEVKPFALIDPFRDMGGATPLFWSPAPDEEAAYDPADAAALLIHALAFDTAGIKTGAVGDPEVKRGKLYGNPVGPRGQVGSVIPVGRNLFETILLNTPVISDGLPSADLPHWRRPPATASWSMRAPEGPLDWLTWVGRRARLISRDDGRVDGLVLAGGDRFPPPSPDWEVHSAWRRVKNPKAEDPPRRPLRHRSGRSAWQGMDSLVALSRGADDPGGTDPPKLVAQIERLLTEDALDANYPLSAQVVGYEYGTQSAVVENLITDEVPFPLAAARTDGETAELVDDIVRSAADLAAAVNRLDGDLRVAAGGEPTPWDKGQRPDTLLVQRLDPAVRRILRGLQTEPGRVAEAGVAWKSFASRATRSLGNDLLRSIPPEAFSGREANVAGKTRVVRAATADSTFQWRINQALAVFDGYADDIESEEDS